MKGESSSGRCCRDARREGVTKKVNQDRKNGWVLALAECLALFARASSGFRWGKVLRSWRNRHYLPTVTPTGAMKFRYWPCMKFMKTSPEWSGVQRQRQEEGDKNLRRHERKTPEELGISRVIRPP